MRRLFFSSPVKYSDIMNSTLSKKVYSTKKMRAKKRDLQNILEDFALVFSAIKNNSPLAIYQLGYHEEKEIYNKLIDLIKYIDASLTKSYERSPNLDKSLFTKVLLALGFYLGLSKLLNEIGIKRVSQEGVNIKKIREDFRNLNKLFQLNLNDVILGNEVNKIEKDIQGVTVWKRLIEVINYGEKQIRKLQKRNFFAHAGFEGNVTECKYNEKHIHIRYCENYFNLIKSWLIESL